MKSSILCDRTSCSWLKLTEQSSACCMLHAGFVPRFSLIGMGGWSPIGSTRHCGHQYAYCGSPCWLWWWGNWWNDWQGKPKYSEKNCPCAALSTTNPTCCPDANPGRRDGKPATKRFSYGTAFVCRLLIGSEDGGSMFFWLPFTGIHDVISQKIEFISATFYFCNS
jgi:hypothetical protein